MVSFWDLKLFPVHRVFIFQVDFVFVVFRQPQVIFVHADGLLMFEKEVQILRLEFVRDLEIATPGNVVSGKLNPGSAWNIAFDDGADFGCGVVCEGIHFVLLHLNDAHEVIPLNGES